MYIDDITSALNPKIKDLIALQSKSKERKERGLFVVEGKREFGQALDGGFSPESIFFCEDYLLREDLLRLLDDTRYNLALFRVSRYIYDKIAYRGDSEGIVAIFKTKEYKLSDIKLSANPLILVLESVEKPGNLGAVLRTADAAHADAVIVCDPLTDLYNPNLIRAGIGAAFSVKTVACNSEEAYKWLKSNGIAIITAQLQDSQLYYDTDMVQPVAIVMGSEDAGLTDYWRAVADAKVRIPMLGKLDSLNVSVSAAILCFEAVRQRNNKTP